ncbi:MAG: hypothetical protein PF505_08880 [Vallitaleaceae bacterium]|jgi:hypothetical protein|nr:hypothetical protein [Vallitaleaceae bacterium]
MKTIHPIVKEILWDETRTGGTLCSSVGKFFIGTCHENNSSYILKQILWDETRTGGTLCSGITHMIELHPTF